MRLTPVESASLSDRVASTLREGIVDGTFPPGTKLTEPELARQLKTSRGPIREALRALEREGLVIARPYRSVRVAEISDDEVENVLIPIRLIVEKYAFSYVNGSLSSEDRANLEDMLTRMKDAASQGQREQVGDLDVRFHQYVLERSGQDQCVQIWRSLQPRIRAHFRREQARQQLDDVYQEHVALYEALRSGDQDRLDSVLEEHIVAYPGRKPWR